jgi:hypothetical protein
MSRYGTCSKCERKTVVHFHRSGWDPPGWVCASCRAEDEERRRAEEEEAS